MIVPNAAAACPYRVGDYLFSENATHPSTSWPGTSWVQVQERTILGASEDYPVGSEGGEAEHTLTIQEMPSHGHTVSVKPVGAPTITGGNYFDYQSGDHRLSNANLTGDTGDGQPHNNMPPYRAAYIWRRTA